MKLNHHADPCPETRTHLGLQQQCTLGRGHSRPHTWPQIEESDYAALYAEVERLRSSPFVQARVAMGEALGAAIAEEINRAPKRIPSRVEAASPRPERTTATPDAERARRLAETCSEQSGQDDETDHDFPQICPACVAAALALARSEGRREGIEEALREVNAMKQRNALARDRAAAAGRENVASHRQSDVESCEQIEAALRALSSRSGGGGEGSK